ncbi:hypothetical protein B0H14DRAFT_315318 [Mycena olivaceomarginata]|nr:hypothetical protein B0H14DRAFT_315318 [Mycena olivaceomarginata]
MHLQTQDSIRVIPSYYSKNQFFFFRQRRTLRKIVKDFESGVKQIGTTKDMDNVKILFVQSNESGESLDFPFGKGTTFLRWNTKILLEKLVVVVHPSRENDLKQKWGTLVDKGLKVVAYSTLVPGSLVPSTPAPAPLSLQSLRTASAIETRRHAEQAVILLVGHTGHGKSKTINRLIGQDLLPVGRTTLGSTTKVRKVLA